MALRWLGWVGCGAQRICKREVNAYTHCFMLGMFVRIQSLLGDPAKTLVTADELAELAEQHGLADWLQQAKCCAVLATIESGAADCIDRSEDFLISIDGASPGPLGGISLGQAAALSNGGRHTEALRNLDVIIESLEGVSDTPQHIAGEIRLSKAKVVEA